MAIKDSYRQIEVVEGDFFPYVLGRFEDMGVYSIGVMDLDDDNARSGGISDIVFHFLISDDEFGWYENDRRKLNDLAQTLQIRMPKSRFLASISASGKDAETMKKAADHAISDQKLENDEAFEQWKADRIEKAKAAAKIKAEETPFKAARRQLAMHQRLIQKADAHINKIKEEAVAAMKQENPEVTVDVINQKLSSNEQLTEIVESRNEESAKGKNLEQVLGKLILTAPELYVALDTCWVKKFPLIDPFRSSIAIFSTREIADRFCKVINDKHMYQIEMLRVPQEEIKKTLRFWESLGVAMLLVDDTEMPCHVLIKNILPPVEKGFIENHNSVLRNLVVRNIQTSLNIKNHVNDMEDEWKKKVMDAGNKLVYHYLNYLSKTVVYCPVMIADKAVPNFVGNMVYSKDANDKIQTLIRQENRKNPPMSRPGFTGKHIVADFADSMLPVRIVTTPDSKNWMAAFTSREEAVEANKNQPVQIIALSLADLDRQIVKAEEYMKKKGDQRVLSGIVLDPHTIFSPLEKKQIALALNIK